MQVPRSDSGDIATALLSRVFWGVREIVAAGGGRPDLRPLAAPCRRVALPSPLETVFRAASGRFRF